MGTQIPISNDCSRTNWSPVMERFFIDLMLDHMHKGNRGSHTFGKEAWTDMLSVLNAKFSLKYDKDALKTRYSSLWKQFNDVKILLSHNGFSWDDTRQIIVADEYVWDAYLKAHPDARPYKTKSFPNFSDLCLIYRYPTADGRYSRSSHDMDIDNDIRGVNSGDASGSLDSPCIERVKTVWTRSMDEYFVEMMLNQQESGDKLDSAFSKQSWIDMLNLFNSKFGPNHSTRVLRHRYNKLMKYYTDITFLLKQNGFSWDESKQMVGAGNDVWNAYLKQRPHLRLYRTMILPYYKDLGLIFGDTSKSGIQCDSCLDRDLEDDISVPKSGGKRSRTYWTQSMDTCLVDLLLEQVHKGNRFGDTFISQAWSDMVTSFNKQFKSHYDRDVLKNRYNQLKRKYNGVKNLLEQYGFSWDEKREIVTAADNVWKAFTKTHPDAQSYRMKTVPSYQKLCVIYGQDRSSERYSRLAENIELQSEEPFPMIGEENDMSTLFRSVIEDGELSYPGLEIEVDYKAYDLDMDEVTDLHLPNMDLEAFNQMKKRPPEMPPALEQSVKTQNICKEQTKLKPKNIEMVNKMQKKNNLLIENAIVALQAVPDIDDELLLDGCDLLEDERKAKTFLALDLNLRKKWLIRKLSR